MSDCDCEQLKIEIEQLRTELNMLRDAVRQIADIINKWLMVKYPGMGDNIRV
ncbi:MAG: hypothetical protein ACTSPE_03805 [Candidatus Thorarchaeota archaeon]